MFLLSQWLKMLKILSIHQINCFKIEYPLPSMRTSYPVYGHSYIAVLSELRRILRDIVAPRNIVPYSDVKKQWRHFAITKFLLANIYYIFESWRRVSFEGNIECLGKRKILTIKHKQKHKHKPSREGGSL